MSWYGNTPVTAMLGGPFHSRRLRLISSQVGKIAPSHRPRWTYSRRLAASIALLKDPRLDALLAPPISFQDLAKRLPDILDARSGILCQPIAYPKGATLFTVEVRDHIMIAHSFRGAVFGPAQKLHGATFVVDVDFRSQELDENGIVIDIGRATEALRVILAELNYRNLDEEPAFKGRNTTTEFICKYIHDGLAKPARAGELGRNAQELKAIRVTLSKSHVARARYEAPLW